MAEWGQNAEGVHVLEGEAATAAADSFFGAPQAQATPQPPLAVAGARAGDASPNTEQQQSAREASAQAQSLPERTHAVAPLPAAASPASSASVATKGQSSPFPAEYTRREMGSVESIQVVGSRLIDDESDAPFHLYEIEVQLSSGASWLVYKRFKQLRAFHGCIQYFPICNGLPPIPSTPFFSKKLNLVDKRSRELSAYFKGLLDIAELQETHAFRDFFEVPVVGPAARQFKILFPLPDIDFDPTECAVPWKKLRQHGGFSFTFATEKGNVAQADPMQLRKEGVLFGAMGADVEAKLFYSEMASSEEFRNPICYEDIHPEDYDGLWLTGGHAKGMRQYLESEVLQSKLVPFMNENKPVAAICHGSLLLARCKNPHNEGKSVLYNRRTATLCKTLERLGHAVTSWKHGDLYRTYEEYCEDEVRRHLKDADTQFLSGPFSLGLTKGTAYDDSAAFVVDDGTYVSARWPGDAYLLAAKFIQLFHW